MSGRAATTSLKRSLNFCRSALDYLGAAGQFVVLALLCWAATDRHGDDDVGDERQQRAQVGHHGQQRERVANGRLGGVGPRAPPGPCTVKPSSLLPRVAPFVTSSRTKFPNVRTPENRPVTSCRRP